MRRRQRAMSLLILGGCLSGIVGIPLGWGAHEPARFCRTAAECPDLRWPTASSPDEGRVVDSPATTPVVPHAAAPAPEAPDPVAPGPTASAGAKMAP